MTGNDDNTLGSGFLTDNGQAGGDSLGSGFVTSAEPTATAPQAAANTLADTFTDIKELSAQGAMSTVYQGKKYGKWHIIKRIKPQYKDNPQYRELFIKEFDNGVQLDHPNIVRFEDKGEDAQGLWYTMEYVDGRPLSELIKTGELIKNESLARSIIEQLCDALSYVHKKQIVHRDLKPDNILVTYRGDNVKLLDFGLAYADRYDDNLIKAGTPKYAAPEQMTKGNLVDQRADIYSLGLIILEMCTGSLVDRTASTVQNPNFKLIINRATQAAPEDRYHDCREILNDLNSQVITGTPLQNPQPAEVRPVSRPATTQVDGERKKNKLPIILGIIAAAAIVGIAIFLLTRNGETPSTNSPTANNTEQNTAPAPPAVKDTPAENNTQTADDNTAVNNQNNGPTEEEKKKNEQDSKLKEEFENLLAQAQKAFDDKNVARARTLYNQIATKEPSFAEAKNEAREKISQCDAIISKYNLYTLTKVTENGKIGYKDREGYIVVDYLYKDVNPNRNAKAGNLASKLLAVQNVSGKWGVIDDATKRPFTDFVYRGKVESTDVWYLNNGYKLFITNSRWDVLSAPYGAGIVKKYQKVNGKEVEIK